MEIRMDLPMSTSTRGFANPNHPMHKPATGNKGDKPASGIPAAGNAADKPPSGLPAMGPGWAGPTRAQKKAARAVGIDLTPPPIEAQIAALVAAEAPALPKPETVGVYSPVHIVNPHQHEAPRGKLGRALTAAEFQRRASEHVEEALATLRAAQEWAPEWGVRVMAAEKLIDRAFGRANQPLSVSTDDMTPAERDARIEFLLAKRRARDGLAVAGITGTTDALAAAPTIDAEGRPVDATKPNGQAT